MTHRSLKSRLTALACATLATCLLVIGQEAKSALRPFFVASTEGPRPFREGQNFHLRVHSDGAPFTKETKVEVKYSDGATGVLPVVWKVVGAAPDKEAHCLRVLVKPELPKAAKACDDCSQVPSSASGSGSIVVTTTNPETTSMTPIPVSLVEPPDGP